jgi:hypothetical protein
MRAAVALVLSAVLVALSWAPHVHHGVRGDHDCPACVARCVDAARSETPDVAPQQVPLPGVVIAPVEIEPAGAPLGAIPGQSPPANA